MNKEVKIRSAKDFDIEYVRSLIDYNPETGIFHWKVARGHIVKAGDICGSPAKDGKLKVLIEGITIRMHVIAWALTYNKIPDDRIFHINNNIIDNRIDNLSATEGEVKKDVKEFKSNETNIVSELDNEDNRVSQNVTVMSSLPAKVIYDSYIVQTKDGKFTCYNNNEMKQVMDKSPNTRFIILPYIHFANEPRKLTEDLNDKNILLLLPISGADEHAAKSDTRKFLLYRGFFKYANSIKEMAEKFKKQTFREIYTEYKIKQENKNSKK